MDSKTTTLKNQSKYDPTRKTVGAMYLDAAKSNTEKFVTNGDLTNELMSSLVCDLNDTIQSNPYEGRSFFIDVDETKDLQMPRMIKRRMLTTVYRPWPEDNTCVFWANPQTNEVRFCWCLPHSTEMDNMLMNELLYDKEMINDIKQWKNLNLYHFGFTKDNIGNWIMNFDFKDRPLGGKVIGSKLILDSF